MEQHSKSIERQRKAAKKQQKESKAAAAATAPAAGAQGQAWVPFDRDKDLQVPTSKEGKSRYQAMVDGDTSLGSRFHKG